MNLLKKGYCRVFQICFRIALPILPYRNPKQLDGVDKIQELLKEKGKKSVLLVIDHTVRSLGLTKALEDGLEAAGIKACVYEQKTPNPTIADVETAREMYINAKAQATIAVGGGSAMDCAKGVGARIARPKKPISKMRGILKIMRKTPLMIAVPTTAGTGSEATLAAVITDGETHHKYPVNDFPLIPDYAVLDPKLTLGLPPFITATTGLDALTHAVEAYIGRSTNKLTRAMSEEAVKLIYENLCEAYHNGSNVDARKNMLRASYCAGVSFTRSYVGYVHGVAHSLGGQYGIAHGLANAVILPIFLRRYGKSAEKKLAKLAISCGLVDEKIGKEKAAEQFILWIEGMNKEFNLPTGFEEIKECDIPVMARHADKESNPLYPVPKLMDAKELSMIYRQLMINAKNESEIEKMKINELVETQREYFNSGATLPISFRKAALKKLKASIIAHESDINKALQEDLGKSTMETYMCETGMTLSELSYMYKHIRRWWRPKHVPTNLANFAAKSFTVRNPYGVVLVMSPWNYPFMLTMEPLIGAIACGNCCVVKPSAYSPATSAVIKLIIEECFDPNYVAVVEGGRAENQTLLDQVFDYIFFTGGVNVGKEVMTKAAKNLTPVTLELGGKSPCVIDSTAKIDLAAKRLAFGKVLNCGQTCVAPDYVLIDKRIRHKFVERLKYHLTVMAGEKPLLNEEYVHMINEKHFNRVMGLINQEKVAFGGQGDEKSLRIEPTIMLGVTEDDAVMQEEIFGPLIPMIEYNTIDEAIKFINSRPHPLACYLFSNDKDTQEKFMDAVPFGGGCINDTIIHLATSAMGFGGVGASGMGSYHGKKSLDTFSHEKSIVKKYNWIDLFVRYAPYNNFKASLLKIFLK